MTESTLAQERLAYLDLMREVEDFFYREADLLDEREYDEWLDLLTEDIVYWMPMRKNVSFKNRDRDITAEDDLAWFHDDKDTLIKRVRQIQTGIHWADEPISRISHLITNIRLADPISSLDDGEKVTTKCRFIVYRNRLETETDILVGRREDTLTRVDGELKIAWRKIILDQSVLLAKNLTMFF
ncbi:3-phenylpropionate/cinnamic acid dioxygenase subunit beta [Candidatus Rariloculus sp.]|uniref:3-phenylpropionate/cinnamic acid dioxygenase subunit beta n=1 Tax=Candidatus Rariloculus sp. TaxID=3101265 RepID=UPI003D0B016E